MTSTACRICSDSASEVFSALLIRKYSVKYFQCPKCGYLQTEEPFWLEEAYLTSINDSDTGMMMRSLWNKNIAATLIYFLFDKNGQFLDYGGGYGVFVRLMRDIGFDYYWQDKYTENLFALGFENTKIKNGKIELLTCFEAFEHFIDPVTELEKLLKTSQNLLISTEFYSEPLPKPDEWWYFSPEHGQHIGFFQKKTFRYLASKFNLFFYTNGQNIHLLTEKRLPPLAFKWLSKFSKIITPFLKIRMKSLTIQDSEKMKVSS